MTKEKPKKQENGTVKRQDILENPAKIVFLSLGSNLGNKKRNIELAKFKLNNADIKIIKSSKNYETLAWPDKKKPKFVNTALKCLITSLLPFIDLSTLKKFTLYK